MKVIIRAVDTTGQRVSYVAIAKSTIDAVCAAIDRGFVAVTARAA